MVAYVSNAGHQSLASFEDILGSSGREFVLDSKLLSSAQLPECVSSDECYGLDSQTHKKNQVSDEQIAVHWSKRNHT